jgi:flagellar basal-body rod protein FlgB
MRAGSGGIRGRHEGNRHVRMAATHPGHIQEDLMRGAVRSGSFGDVEVHAFRKLRQFADELSKTGEIKRMYELNTGMVKAFHRMMLLTVREICR